MADQGDVADDGRPAEARLQTHGVGRDLRRRPAHMIKQIGAHRRRATEDQFGGLAGAAEAAALDGGEDNALLAHHRAQGRGLGAALLAQVPLPAAVFKIAHRGLGSHRGIGVAQVKEVAALAQVGQQRRLRITGRRRRRGACREKAR